MQHVIDTFRRMTVGHDFSVISLEADAICSELQLDEHEWNFNPSRDSECKSLLFYVHFKVDGKQSPPKQLTVYQKGARGPVGLDLELAGSVRFVQPNSKKPGHFEFTTKGTPLRNVVYKMTSVRAQKAKRRGSPENALDQEVNVAENVARYAPHSPGVPVGLGRPCVNASSSDLEGI